jgi:hypothetical protein
MTCRSRKCVTCGIAHVLPAARLDLDARGTDPYRGVAQSPTADKSASSRFLRDASRSTPEGSKIYPQRVETRDVFVS